MTPFVLFHLTIIILIATCLHLILSILKFSKYPKKSELAKPDQNMKNIRKQSAIQWNMNREELIRNIEQVKSDFENLQDKLDNINRAIDRTTKDNQRLINRYFRSYHWTKSNKK
jgi:predicted RNase H-like nuclease (RuvC/YqgF family)